MWRTVTSNRRVLRVLESGYRLTWAGRKPPLVSLPPPFFNQSHAQAELALDQEIASLIAKRAIEQVQLPSPGFYGRIFVVPKATGGWRPVLDLSPLNRYLERVKFKMETQSSVRQAVQQNDWATSIDLKDAYFHILIHPNDRKWLRFVWKQKAFQFRALPFGLSPAPLIFTRVVREFAGLARQKAIRLSCYLDDWLILAQSQDICIAHTRQVLHLAESLGFIPNPEKCDLTPSQSFEYLGMAFDTTSMLVRPTQARLEKLHSLLLDLRSSQTASARRLSSLLGTMESLAPIVPLGRLLKRPLQREFRQRWNQAFQPWDAPIQLGPWFLSSTSQWLDLSLLASGVPIVSPTPEVELYTDASCVGWGGARQFPQRCGHLVSGGEELAHQQTGTGSSLPFPAGIPSPSIGQGCPTVHRQYNSSFLCEQARGSTLHSPLPGSRIPSPVVPSPQDHPVSQAHTWQTQHPGGLVEQVPLCASNRMDHQPRLPSPSLGAVVQTDGRPIRDEVQPPPATVHFTSPRPRSPSRRRSVSELVQSPGLRLPSSPHHEQSSQKGKRRRRKDDSHRTSVASPTLVPRPSVPHALSSTQTVPTPGPTHSTSVRSAPQQPQPTQATRLEAVREVLRSSGASSAVVDLVCKSRRPQTESVYGHKWDKWVSWCNSHSIRPADPSSSEVANFLAWLSSDMNLAASTIKGYRSAISTTLRQLGSPGFSEDQLLRDVTRAISLQEARAPRRVPRWDLFLVLGILREDPFEPLSDISFKFLTLKTAFLLALATGRRRSEIHGLSGAQSDISFEQDGSVSLRFLPEFLAKNQDPGSPSPVLRVKSLSSILSRSDTDRNLCPVRCLRFYLSRSHPRRSSQRRLLISMNEDYAKDISAGTVSRWISSTVSLAYQRAETSMSVLHPRAHEVRALASSAAFLHATPMSSILEAAFWKSENPFINHYLRDLRCQRADGTFGISFVAAQTTIAATASRE